MSDLISTNEAAHLTGYAQSTVQRYAPEIKGAVKLGNSWLFTDKAALKKWAADRMETARVNRLAGVAKRGRPTAAKIITIAGSVSPEALERNRAKLDEKMQGKEPLIIDGVKPVKTFNWRASVGK